MTDIEIIRAALGALGCESVSQADMASGASAEAVIAAAQYATIRDALLQSRQWTFAKDRIQLAEDSTPPVFGLNHRYIIPNDVLMVLRLFDGTVTTIATWWDADSGSDALTDWIREGGYILTDNIAPVFAEVIKKVSESAMPPLFVKALIAQCAADWALPLTENRAVADSWELKAEKRLGEAALQDGKQGVSEVLKPAKLPGRRR